MPAAHEVKSEEKSGGGAVCAAALATVKAAAMPPARSCVVEANLDIVLSLVRPLGAVLRKTIFDIYAAMPSSWNTPRMAVRSAS
jgi:hypothetical protein